MAPFARAAAAFAGDLLCPARQFAHPALGTEHPAHQTTQGKIGIARRPVQSEARTGNLDRGDLRIAGIGQFLNPPRGKSEGAAVGKIDHDPPARRIISGGCRPRLAFHHLCAARFRLRIRPVRRHPAVPSRTIASRRIALIRV